MFSKILALGLVAVTALGLVASASEPQSYVAPTTPIVSVSFSAAGTNVGGVTFPAPEGVPVEVIVDDASGAPVSFTACQDFTGDNFCDVGEPSVTGCGSADLSVSEVPFLDLVDVVVFIQLASPDCGGIATSGVVTLIEAPVPADE